MALFGDTYIEPCVTGRVNKRFNGLRCHSQRTGVPFKPGLGSASFGERTGSIGEVGDSGSEGILEDVERAASYKSSASAMQRQLTGSTHALRVTHVERRYVIRVTVRTRVRSRRTRASRLEVLRRDRSGDCALSTIGFTLVKFGDRGTCNRDGILFIPCRKRLLPSSLSVGVSYSGSVYIWRGSDQQNARARKYRGSPDHGSRRQMIPLSGGVCYQSRSRVCGRKRLKANEHVPVDDVHRLLGATDVHVCNEHRKEYAATQIPPPPPYSQFRALTASVRSTLSRSATAVGATGDGTEVRSVGRRYHTRALLEEQIPREGMMS